MELNRLILVFLGISLCDALEVEENLTGTVGGNITLPDAVPQYGSLLLHRRRVIVMVRNRELEIHEDIYMNRIDWNETSGLFTLTNLQKNDSGIYSIDSKRGRVFTASYNLTVYDSVAPPAVHTLTVSSDSCSLLCAVDKAAEITLWWYKDQELVNQSSSAGSLPLTVTKQDLSSSYRCVAGNPAELKTLLVDVKTSCSGLNEAEPRHRWIIIGVTLVAVVVFSLAAFLIRKCFRNNKKTTIERQGSVDSRPGVQYTAVNVCVDSQSQGGNLPDSPGSVDHRVEPRLMVPPDSNVTSDSRQHVSTTGLPLCCFSFGPGSVTSEASAPSVAPVSSAVSSHVFTGDVGADCRPLMKKTFIIPPKCCREQTDLSERIKQDQWSTSEQTAPSSFKDLLL